MARTIPDVDSPGSPGSTRILGLSDGTIVVPINAGGDAERFEVRANGGETVLSVDAVTTRTTLRLPSYATEGDLPELLDSQAGTFGFVLNGGKLALWDGAAWQLFSPDTPPQ